MGYLPQERETVINTNDAASSWHIYTSQRKIITKLKRIGAEPYKVEKEGDRIIGAFYRIDYKQISFRKLVALTAQQKQDRRAHLDGK